MTKRSLRRLRQKDRIRARLAGDPVPDTPEQRKKVEAAYESCPYTIKIGDKVVSTGEFRLPVKSWRIIAETDEGLEWLSQPIRSAIEPAIEMIDGVKRYRIEEIKET